MKLVRNILLRLFLCSILLSLSGCGEKVTGIKLIIRCERTSVGVVRLPYNPTVDMPWKLRISTQVVMQTARCYEI